MWDRVQMNAVNSLAGHRALGSALGLGRAIRLAADGAGGGGRLGSLRAAAGLLLANSARGGSGVLGGAALRLLSADGAWSRALRGGASTEESDEGESGDGRDLHRGNPSKLDR